MRVIMRPGHCEISAPHSDPDDDGALDDWADKPRYIPAPPWLRVTERGEGILVVWDDGSEQTFEQWLSRSETLAALRGENEAESADESWVQPTRPPDRLPTAQGRLVALDRPALFMMRRSPPGSPKR